MRTSILLLALLAVAAHAEELAVERALIVTLTWEGDSISVDKIDRREAVVPAQRGFPQLLPKFFELRDKDGDVHYSGGLADPRGMPHGAPPAGKVTKQLVLPDLEDARHLVILKRVSRDPETGRKVLLETDL